MLKEIDIRILDQHLNLVDLIITRIKMEAITTKIRMEALTIATPVAMASTQRVIKIFL